MGFRFAYKLSGGAPTMVTSVAKAAAVISVGEMVNVESGEIDAGAAGDVGLAGIAVEDCDNTADGLSCRHIIDPDAVYAVVDANARAIGATLDLASGAKGVTTSSSTDLIVVADSSATEETLVKIIATSHYLGAAV